MKSLEENIDEALALTILEEQYNCEYENNDYKSLIQSQYYRYEGENTKCYELSSEIASKKLQEKELNQCKINKKFEHNPNYRGRSKCVEREQVEKHLPNNSKSNEEE